MKSSSFTDFFIQRPVFSWVINIIVVLLGIVGAWQLSTRQYPIVEKPLVTIKAQMDASIKVLEEQVATKIEDACAAIQGLSDMKTDVRQREVVLKLTFEDRSMDAAAADVRDQRDARGWWRGFPEPGGPRARAFQRATPQTRPARGRDRDEQLRAAQGPASTRWRAAPVCKTGHIHLSRTPPPAFCQDHLPQEWTATQLSGPGHARFPRIRFAD